MTQSPCTILAPAAVEALHTDFAAGLERKARQALPAGAENPGALVCLGAEYLHALSQLRRQAGRRGALSALMAQGPRAVHAQTMLLREEYAADIPAPLRKSIEVQARKRRGTPQVSAVFGAADRLYLEFGAGAGQDAAASKVAQDIAAWLNTRGYRVVDYTGGYATDAKGKQKFKIGRLLSDKNLLKAFSEDKARQAPENLLAVVSRRPEDIARMSVRRGWKSCMAPGAKHAEDLAPHVGHGVLVAYLVSKNDPDAHDPLARILLKPFVRAGLKGIFAAAAQKTVHVPYLSYGLPSAVFLRAVTHFAELHLNSGLRGTFVLHDKIYGDFVSCPDDVQMRYKKGPFRSGAPVFSVQR